MCYTSNICGLQKTKNNGSKTLSPLYLFSNIYIYIYINICIYILMWYDIEKEVKRNTGER